MDRETVNRIEVLDTGELLLGLEGLGKSIYQYIYREAAGVYWDQALHGFKSTPMKEWSCAQRYKQIVSVARSGLGVELSLGDHITWSNYPRKKRQKSSVKMPSNIPLQPTVKKLRFLPSAELAR